jgi:hypothetical protein
LNAGFDGPKFFFGSDKISGGMTVLAQFEVGHFADASAGVAKGVAPETEA